MENQKLYVIVRGENYEGYEIIGNHLDKKTACEFARKVAEGMANDRYPLQTVSEMHWVTGCDYISVEEININEMDLFRIKK